MGEWKPPRFVRADPDSRLDMTTKAGIGMVIGPENQGSWLQWYHADGSPDGQHGCAISSSELRPLVVLDPEDREQVEAFRHLILTAFREQNDLPLRVSAGALGNATQAALRALANPQPPKPDEPTGLGAVVEVESARPGLAGMKVRLVRTHATHEPWWGDNRKRDWDEISGPIVVLSEGVTP